MKTLLLILLIISGGLCSAQNQMVYDTIYANNYNNTALFFPSEVTRGIVGATNFTFSYNLDMPQSFGLLKASPGKHSNLLVLTEDGSIYSYILSYREKLPVYNYFISTEKSIGNLFKNDSLALSIHKKIKDEVYVKNGSISRKETYYRNLCSFYLRSSSGNIETEREQGIKLRVEEIHYHRNEAYFIFSLENNSQINFEISYLKLYLIRGNKKRNASYQKLKKVPVFLYRVPKKVLPGQKQRFVLVFEKFTMGDNGRIGVELREKNGSRFLHMNLKK